MSNNLNRRKFITSLSTLAVGLPFAGSALDVIAGSGRSFDFSTDKDSDFNFMLFGDMHYDDLKYHDFDYVKKKFSADDIRQQKEYSNIALNNLPKLMTVSKKWADDSNAKFYLQLGDVVEGLAGSNKLATGQAESFINFIAQQKLGKPFIVVKGNHDITGTGAKEMYLNTILPWQNEELQHNILAWNSMKTDQSLNLANRTFVYNSARFIIYDCFNEESLDWLKTVLKEHDKSQQLFFCTHVPVVPYDDRSTWHIFAHNQQKREELLNLLGQFRAIVLSAHLHKFGLVTRNTPSGNFVQLGIGSVIYGLNAPIKNHLQGLDSYNADLVNLEPHFSPASLEERKQILIKEKPHIRSYEYADICGYGLVKVSDKVELSVFVNADKKPWKIVNLTDMLNI